MSVINKMNILSEHFVLKADCDFKLWDTRKVPLTQVAETTEECRLLFSTFLAMTGKRLSSAESFQPFQWHCSVSCCDESWPCLSLILLHVWEQIEGTAAVQQGAIIPYKEWESLRSFLPLLTQTSYYLNAQSLGRMCSLLVVPNSGQHMLNWWPLQNPLGVDQYSVSSNACLLINSHEGSLL